MRGKQLSCVMLLVLMASFLLPCLANGASAVENCIILVDGSEAFLKSYADGLHAVIDILPAELEVGIMLAGQAAHMREPIRLSRARRAELHAFLERAHPIDEVADSAWDTMIRFAIDLLAGRGGGQGSVVVLHSDSTLPDAWQELMQLAAEWGVLLYEVDLSVPHVREGAVQEHRPPDQLAQWGLVRLLELVGLAAGELTAQAYSDSGMQLAFSVPAGVKSLTFQWDRSLAPQVLLTTPTGDLVDPQSDFFQTQLLAGPDYTSFHLTQSVLPQLSDWQGQWIISASNSIGLGVWFSDPAWLQPNIRETKGQRIISLVTNIDGMDPYPGNQMVVLQDWRGKPLIELNDLGINGDGVAGDGIYAAVLPSFVSAGPAILHVQGSSSERLQTVIIPAATPADSALMDSPDIPIHKFLIAGLGLVVSGFGMVQNKKNNPAIWRISHQGNDGYWHSYDLKTDMLLIGSGEHCQIRLARSGAFEQVRLRQVKDAELRLDVLAIKPSLAVNDVQVYIGKHLEHGDRITVAGETLLVEKLARLRSGKHSA